MNVWGQQPVYTSDLAASWLSYPGTISYNFLVDCT